jgi:hypothetical protein
LTVPVAIEAFPFVGSQDALPQRGFVVSIRV